MWILTYSGNREDSSFRHPEQLVELAPPYLQQGCAAYGGVNHRGEPNFRAVRVGSRYMIAGGHEFRFLDTNGNYQMTCPAEMLVPRYMAKRPEWGLWLLERWHPPEWYYRNGFAGRADDVDYSPTGEATRRVEPIWPEGGYEACWWDEIQLLILPKDVPVVSGSISLAWAIRSVLRTEEIEKAAVLEAYRKQYAEQEKKEIEEGTDLAKEKTRATLFIEPAVSYAGIEKEGLWPQNTESCA